MTAGRPDDLSARLARAGCVAADEEAAELRAAAGDDARALEAMTERRVRGEPLAWITGGVDFGGTRVTVWPRVYVPRLQTVPLARRAASLLPAGGCAVDLCTGAGAVAALIARLQPEATVVATDIDELAVACARANHVDALAGDLYGPLPRQLAGQVDVVTAVTPYVPTPELRLLPADVQQYEPGRALDGGDDGLTDARRVLDEAPRWLRAGGWLLLELGGDQPALLGPALERHDFTDVEVLEDDDGDTRGIVARWLPN